MDRNREGGTIWEVCIHAERYTLLLNAKCKLQNYPFFAATIELARLFLFCIFHFAFFILH